MSKEAPVPAARDDCYQALVWLKENAAALGGRVDQVVVVGASAGGGLTAAISLYARDLGEVNIAFQCPLYPMIDDRETPSSEANDAPVWDGVTNQNAWRLYLGDLYGGDVPSYAAAARASDLRGLPPTITYVGDIEPFRDETISCVEALARAGVRVEFRLVPGAWHGFDGVVPWSRAARSTKAWYQEKFSSFLGQYTASQPG